ncbi:MAG: hypothetical protein KC933_38240, partial [Myxococcales bacterium]|nr:hypothetical protein [Myxococcales bacterium]
MKNRESIATRALVTVLAGMLVVSAASMLAFYVVQKQRYDDKTVEAGKALLSGLDHESAESLEKGQRATFQAVLDSFAKIDAIEYAALYSPAGLMTYRSGQVSVGMPFVHEDGEFKNPNLELYQESDGRYARADWEMVNHVDSERALEHVKEKRQKKEQCIDCHFSVSKDLAFDDDQMAWILADEAPVFFHRIDATADCLTCHTNWKVGEPAGYLSV